MDKSSLMEYLSVVCDAENALYACDEAINSLQLQKQQYRRLLKPEKPKKITVSLLDNKTEQETRAEKIMIRISSVILCIVIFVGIEKFFTSNLPDYYWISIIIGFPLSICLGILGAACLIHIFMVNPRVKKTNQNRIESTNKKNKIAEESYSKNLERYNQTLTIEDHFFDEMNKAISGKNTLKASLYQQLNQLYSMNIIHPTFRNMIAVNQIREYLEMGVCDALEGPNGAYAQYLQDVRTNRICDSITDLKINLMASLSTFAMTQASIIHELKTTNRNIEQMNQSLSREMSDLRNSLDTAQSATSSQFEAYMQQANTRLKGIENTMSAAAYNQYIALRQSNVRGYLLKAPY